MPQDLLLLLSIQLRVRRDLAVILLTTGRDQEAVRGVQEVVSIAMLKGGQVPWVRLFPVCEAVCLAGAKGDPLAVGVADRALLVAAVRADLSTVAVIVACLLYTSPSPRD